MEAFKVGHLVVSGLSRLDTMQFSFRTVAGQVLINAYMDVIGFTNVNLQK